ncbi:MAG TPA: BamA/TamA family outer membrane protein [Gammaproteobacteria bacterium]|nr:BamA/TamA family outer membrane protein [Gammaproteobacteria bacterium]
MITYGRKLALLSILSLLAAAALGQRPSGRIYVRRIEFEGVMGIDDEVLRREMLQLEGGVLNTAALEQSLRRLDRLPYIKTASAKLRPVPGSADLVDVIVTIQQAPARRYGGGGGYTASLLGSLHAYFVNENLFGTGRRLSFRLDGGPLRSIGGLSYTNPFARPEGVSRTVTLASRSMSQATAHASDLGAEIDSVRLDYGYAAGRAHNRVRPLSSITGLRARNGPGAETPPESGAAMLPAVPVLGESDQTVRFGVSISNVKLTAGASTSAQLLQWMAANGRSSFGGRSSTAYTELALLFGWRYDTRDRAVFPDRGLEQSLSARVAVPGGDAQYYLADYEATIYWTIGTRWTVSLDGHLGFGSAYGGETSSLPPYLNWFAGGSDTVRGYRAGTLGPRDSLDHPYGGNLLLAGRFELLTKWPPRWSKRLRMGVFVDAGNVFSTENVGFQDAAGRRLDYGFGWSKIRRSAGIAVHVLLPLGELRLSYAAPLDSDAKNPDPFLRDREERFQVALGVDTGGP